MLKGALYSISSIIEELQKIKIDSSGIRTHATEVTGALNQRLRPLGHAALADFFYLSYKP